MPGFLLATLWRILGVSPTLEQTSPSNTPIVLGEAVAETSATPVHDEWADAFADDWQGEDPTFSDIIDLESLPTSELWRVPLANQRAPRFYGKFTNFNNESTIDTAIGGQFGFVRLATAGDHDVAVQLGGFGAVFTRFNDRRLLVTSDYRAGVPVTWRFSNWQGKIAYEHTSTHVGDEFAEATGRRQVPHVRDEVVLGLARRQGPWRLYGQAGFSFVTSNVVGDDRDRWNAGVEWTPADPYPFIDAINDDAFYQSVRRWGRPFAAVDFDWRSDQSYFWNVTVQAGWQWVELITGRTGRLMVEYYTGKSPYGQFFRDREEWVGFSAAFDY